MIYLQVEKGKIIGYSDTKYEPYTVEYESDGTEFDFSEYEYSYKNGKVKKSVLPDENPTETSEQRTARFAVRKNEKWFKWYDVQVIQSLRAEVLGNEFRAVDIDGNEYLTVRELHETAAKKAAQIKESRAKMVGWIVKRDITSLGIYAGELDYIPAEEMVGGREFEK